MVAEGPAYLPDEHLDVVGVNMSVAPDPIEQGFFGNHMAGALHEHAQQIGGLAGQWDTDVIAPEDPRRQVESERRKILHVQPLIVTESGYGTMVGCVAGRNLTEILPQSGRPGDPTGLLPQSNRDLHCSSRRMTLVGRRSRLAGPRRACGPSPASRHGRGLAATSSRRTVRRVRDELETN